MTYEGIRIVWCDESQVKIQFDPTMYGVTADEARVFVDLARYKSGHKIFGDTTQTCIGQIILNVNLAAQNPPNLQKVAEDLIKRVILPKRLPN